MILGLALGIGAMGLGVAEIIRIAQGGISTLDGTFEVLGWWTIALGIWALRHMIGFARAGRIAIVLLSFAAMSFGMVMVITLTSGTLGALVSGEISYGDIVFTPFYLLALVFVVGGLSGFALYFWSWSGIGRVFGASFVGLAALHLARLFAPSNLALHGLANILLALALIALCALALVHERGGITAKAR